MNRVESRYVAFEGGELRLVYGGMDLIFGGSSRHFVVLVAGEPRVVRCQVYCCSPMSTGCDVADLGTAGWQNCEQARDFVVNEVEYLEEPSDRLKNFSRSLI